MGNNNVNDNNHKNVYHCRNKALVGFIHIRKYFAHVYSKMILIVFVLQTKYKIL